MRVSTVKWWFVVVIVSFVLFLFFTSTDASFYNQSINQSNLLPYYIRTGFRIYTLLVVHYYI